eukprot:CAMPEP_0197414764 /NCGR_PEP_ID=MMETSP1170-20131217/1454_1 /TAXON_ID=54406 /ORGANISM="Sarcinochrysis sp, Strain CCMP770" /LENGTH=111 /DNA_ID=CAMNT_0042941507 /DNA_START=185 /DNA_END=520 /DNA_ORIENTATION=-
MTFDPLPPEEAGGGVDGHLLEHVELFRLYSPGFPGLVVLFQVPVDLEGTQDLLGRRCGFRRFSGIIVLDGFTVVLGFVGLGRAAVAQAAVQVVPHPADVDTPKPPHTVDLL